MKPIAEQTILITGTTDGLGKQVALELAHQGALILLHGRSPQKLDSTQAEIRAATPNARLESYRADFAALDQVRQLAADVAARHPRLDLLINNAGITSQTRELSADGYELTFAVNYLAHYLLTDLLLPNLRAAAPSRIINVSSAGQYPLDFDNLMFERNYVALNAYRQSKLAQIMSTFDLADELRGEQVTVNALHPASLMATNLVMNSFGYSMSQVEDGAKSVLRLATDPALDGVTGRYFDQLDEARANPQAYDLDARRRLKQLSDQLTGLIR
ncbi:MAG TPA: SDR family NAD(P)-dependent oxidoreductase [Phototrophicaceae bacterium]|nr:SDR family NAD(P)-dependent oxidoreductase [Phototrophicaceae bacterium]